MCGIVGFITDRGDGSDDLAAIVGGMATTLKHRGPDDGGVWTDPTTGVGLGYRRLAILDLSALGQQPMHSRCGRYVLVYNGEVYNFRSLRSELQGHGHVFQGGSDTEVILVAISAWGLEPALSRFNGMFALALWDRRDRELTLVRDRLGQKPLYYGWSGNTFLFGSELRAFRAFPDFDPSIDRNALTLLLRRGCIPGPHSVFEGVYKLEPGHILRLTAEADGEPARRCYWSLNETLLQGARDPFRGTRQEAVEALDELLREAVQLCMVSDVPLGAFLSGGVDSSTVAAMMQAQSQRPVRTFSIGFHHEERDEAPHAARIATYLGTEHEELYVTEEDALKVIPELPRIYDEPFADPSQIPTYLLSRLTREHVTVALSGDGGDELFGGYAKYRHFDRLRHLDRLPRAVRAGLVEVARLLASQVPETRGSIRVRRLAGLLGAATSPDDLYVHVASIWKEPSRLVPGAVEPTTLLTDPGSWPELEHPVRRAMAVDTLTYLPDDILVKVDRAAMAVSLETRIPFLDHRVVELVARLPLSMNYGRGKSKLLLREVLSRYIPSALVERPKMGFDIPLEGWLRQQLRPWAEELLDESRMRVDAIFDPGPIRRLWKQHLAGQADWSGYLWPVLMFQNWYGHYRDTHLASDPRRTA